MDGFGFGGDETLRHLNLICNRTSPRIFAQVLTSTQLIFHPMDGKARQRLTFVGTLVFGLTARIICQGGEVAYEASVFLYSRLDPGRNLTTPDGTALDVKTRTNFRR